MQVLASDKTGTLTLNQLILDKDEIAAAADLSHDDVLLYAALSARWTNNDAIDKAVTAALEGGEQVRLGTTMHQPSASHVLDMDFELLLAGGLRKGCRQQCCAPRMTLAFLDAAPAPCHDGQPACCSSVKLSSAMWQSSHNALAMQATKQYEVTNFVPFNPVDKKTTATVIGPDGRTMKTCKGAPQVGYMVYAGHTSTRIHRPIMCPWCHSISRPALR